MPPRPADLLGQLALGAGHRVLAVEVELAGRQLEDLLVERGPVLAHQDHLPVVVDSDHRHGAGVVTTSR